jgi:hypothetical protein
MTMTLERAEQLTPDQRRNAEQWFQFLRAFVVHTEHVSKGWRVAQQSHMGTRVGNGGQNMIVVQKMHTPIGTRYYNDVQNAFGYLEPKHKEVVVWIRSNGERSRGRECVPTTLYPAELRGARRLERDEIAGACLAFAGLLEIK